MKTRNYAMKKRNYDMSMKKMCLLGLCSLVLSISTATAKDTRIEYKDIHKVKGSVSKAKGTVGGSIKADADNKAQDLRFDFRNCTTDAHSYLRVHLGQKLPGKPSKISWRIKPERGENFMLTLWLTDPSGEVYLLGKKIDCNGEWQNIEYSLVNRGPAWVSGDKNHKMDLPVSLNGFFVHRQGDNTTDGKILLGDWSVDTDLSKGSPFSMDVNLQKHFWGKNAAPVLKIDLKDHAARGIDSVYSTVKIVNRYDGKEVFNRKLTYKSKDAKNAEIVKTLDIPFGSYEITTTLHDGNKKLDSTRKLFQYFMGDCSKMSKTLLEYERDWSPVGGVFGSMSSKLANQFGARWIRFENRTWAQVETAHGVYDTTEIVEAVDKLNDNYVQSVIFQTLYQHPKFRSPSEDIVDFSTGYGMVMKNSAAALTGKARSFELGNEDNGESRFIYTEIARNGAAGIRSAQPFAIQANSGTAFIDHSWIEMQLKRGLFNYLDALCVHPYTNNGIPSEAVSAEKTEVLEKLERLNDLVDMAGGMKELWSTEFGWPKSYTQKGEESRAKLYLREMAIMDAANLRLNGIYTFIRDYGVVNFPAGIAVNAYANMRAGHRFAGLVMDGAVWNAVYERGGDAMALIWTPDEATASYTLQSGETCFDMFGNKLNKKKVEISQMPIYIKGLNKKFLNRALLENCKRKKKFFANCLSLYKSASIGKSLLDIDPRDYKTLEKVLLDWAKIKAPVSGADKAVIGRVVDWYLAASRITSDAATTTISDNALKAKRTELSNAVIKNNEKDLDISGLRWLLNRWERVTADKMLARDDNKKGYAASCQQQENVLAIVADRFSQYEKPFQFAVFTNLYQKRAGVRAKTSGFAQKQEAHYKRGAGAFTEELSFTPGETTKISARVSSYSDSKQKVKVALKLPEGWTCTPKVAGLEVAPLSTKFVDFDIKCPSKGATMHPVINTLTSIAGKPDVTGYFDKIEMRPPVSLEISPITVNINNEAVTVELLNNGHKELSGTVRFMNPNQSGKAVAQFKINKLAPGKKELIPVKLKNLSTAVGKEWALIADVALSDGRRFKTAVKLDFTLAVLAPENITIDGDLKEWKNALPLKLDKAKYGRGSYSNAWSPEDCSAVSYLMWDDKNLYFAAVVTDQTFNQHNDKDTMWKHDSIQLIFAADRESKFRELTLALGTDGPRMWDNKSKSYAKNALIDVVYRDRQIIYEAAIPWAVFGEKFNKEDFLYGIAINDHDAIGSRKFLERFYGSIVHGKNIKCFEPVKLEKAEDRIKLKKQDPNVIFFYDFNEDTPESVPTGWVHHRNKLPADCTSLVVAEKGRNKSNALRMHNSIGLKPHRFDMLYAPLDLVSERYKLEFWVKGNIENSGGLIGTCADAWGHLSWTYASWKPSDQWQKVELIFGGGSSGKKNLVFRNFRLMDELLIDDVKIEKITQK